MYTDSEKELNLVELFCGIDYALEMAIALGADEIGMFQEELMVLVLWPTRYQINFRAMGDEWSTVAQQLMVLYANKLRQP